MNEMKYLVTGGAGFIGSNIVEELLNRGHSVRVLDNYSTGKKENICEFIPDIELIEGDIRNYMTVVKAIKNIDIIFHEAALPSVPRSIIDPIKTNDVNVSGTLNILNAAKEHNVKRIVFASSSSVYGNSDVLPKVENMLPNPLSPYAVTKLTGETYCKVFYELYGIETVCLRYFNVFGPKQDPNSPYSAVIPKFINMISENKKPMVFGDGSQSRDFTYISNVVQANILAASDESAAGHIMNVACNEQITINQLLRSINIFLKKNIVPEFTGTRRGDVKHSYADINLISSRIKYQPLYKFEEGLRKTIDYYTTR